MSDDLKNIVNLHNNRISKENEYYKEVKQMEKLRKTAYTQPGAFESQIERLYNLNDFSHTNVKNLKKCSEEYIRATAYKEKYDSLKSGFDKVRAIVRAEQQYANAVKYSPATARTQRPPSPSSREKLGEVMLDFCNGDTELLGKYMTSITTEMGNSEEVDKNFQKILQELEQKCEQEYKQALGGKQYSTIENNYNAAVARITGSKASKDIAKNFVERAKQQSAYTEMGVTIATILYASYAEAGVKALENLSAKYGANAVKALTTVGGASMPAGFSVLNAATSPNLFDEKQREEIKEKLKSGLIYGGFGAYVSGPLGTAVTNVLSQNSGAISSIISKAMGITAETTADVIFDRLTSDLSFEESLKNNGIMNFGMMFVGGRIAKTSYTLQKLNETKISKNLDGSYNVKFDDGKIVKLADDNELAAFIMGKGLSSELIDKLKNQQPVDNSTSQNSNSTPQTSGTTPQQTTVNAAKASNSNSQQTTGTTVQNSNTTSQTSGATPQQTTVNAAKASNSNSQQTTGTTVQTSNSTPQTSGTTPQQTTGTTVQNSNTTSQTSGTTPQQKAGAASQTSGTTPNRPRLLHQSN